jgi:uncharacterized SAM-binding protein YcdF (DUF218 family)
MTSILNAVSLLGHPLGFLCMTGLVGMLWAFRARQRKLGLYLLTWTVLYWLVCFEPVSNALLGSLERPWESHGSPSFLDGLEPRDGIIVLGGGLLPSRTGLYGTEFNNATDRVLCGLELARLKKGAYLFLSGFDPDVFPASPEYESGMTRLAGIFGCDADRLRFLPHCLNTFDEAMAMQTLDEKLFPDGGRYYLVTSAYHMDRSLRLFQKAGFNVEPVACDFNVVGLQAGAWKYPRIIPFRENLVKTDLAIHEIIGRIVYRLRGWI